MRGLPHIPDRVKRLLLGGRTVTIDGNTLDTTLQLMLTGQKAVGIEGLAMSPDVATARALLSIVAAGYTQNIPVAAVTNLSIPGARWGHPGAALPAGRRRRATAAGLLPRRRPGHR